MKTSWGLMKWKKHLSYVEAIIQVGWQDLNYPNNREFIDRAFTIMAGLTHVRCLTLGECS